MEICLLLTVLVLKSSAVKLKCNDDPTTTDYNIENIPIPQNESVEHLMNPQI